MTLTTRRLAAWLAAAGLLLACRPAFAQQDELARLKAELSNQQAIIAKLIARVEELERKQTEIKEEAADESKAHEDAVQAVRNDLLGRVNLNGYYNFRYFRDQSETPSAFQQHHLGVVLSKQLGRFNVFTELELQNVPHHAEIVAPGMEGEAHSEEESTAVDISGEGQVAVENAWMEYNHNRLVNVRVGKQLSPQYWWQNHYPNLTMTTTLPIYLRELFPPELIGVMVHGSAARAAGASELGLGYKFYVANSQFEGNSRTDLRDGKAWGARLQLRLPTGGRLKRFDVATDVYRGRIGLKTNELVEDHVAGVEGQLEVDRFLFQGEYARGWSLGQTRSGFYMHPGVRLHEDWLAYYGIEHLDSERVRQAERRHLSGVNYRPFPQIALKLEFYRSVPLRRSFIHEDEDERKPFSGLATGAVFFF